MQREAAKKLIRDTLERPFNKEQFSKFSKNLLNRMEDAPFTYQGNYIFADFKDYVETLDRIGKYEDKDGHKLDVLVVHLKKTTSLERARASQRKFVAKYLKGSRGNELKDAALVAFVSPHEEDWRFSFVKMDYKIDPVKGKVVEEFTPARRYSFLVGENENSHTAQSRLLPILENTDKNPNLSDIENAFGIEKVTKEFFEQYRELYYKVKDALERLISKDKNIRADFEEKGVDIVDFAKKLIGQIVFLYFLQKKGWFGVEKHSNWGTGPKNFLRHLFDGSITNKYDNFFNDVLEPLFYEALAVEREADYYSKFRCKIPFLNGGLFDPLNNYDWVHTDVLLPNVLFSNNEKTKQGDTGTGILDVFDRYNFTVKEDEPLEKEVAVDPEMLGKVFENLLEVKDRKSKGTYYTPREIVHYMCQESLINFLATELEGIVLRADIETLIKHGETALENDVLVNERGEEKGMYRFQLPDSIRDRALQLDEKLADIKVCDPAVGSGAFLVGMMSEIVRARVVLTEFLSSKSERGQYDFKRHAIQSSLYGVDIDPSAVEIAKLRLWLSLIVDEDDYKQIKPLPNLDYKIMQGNSLLEEYEGIKLIDERFFEKQDEKAAVRERLEKELSQIQREYIRLDSERELTKQKKSEFESNLKTIDKQLKELDKPRTNGQSELGFYGLTEAHSKAEKLRELHEAFFSAFHKRQKDQLKKQIDNLTWDLVEATLSQQRKSDKIKEVRRFQQTNTRPFFLWRLNFAEIFGDKHGFDIVIANPPYGGYFDSKRLSFSRLYPNTTKQFKDIYKIFIELGLSRLCAPEGILCYITPNTLIRQTRYKDVRKFLMGFELIQIVNLGEGVFEQVVVPTCFFFVRKKTPNSNQVILKDISLQSKFTGELDSLHAKITSQNNFIAESDYSFIEEGHKLGENQTYLEDIIDFKDAGINYQRFNVGMAEKGKSDLGQRLLYEGHKKSEADMEYWKGQDIDKYYIAPSTDRFVRLNTLSSLKANERVILNRKYFALAPKLIWRQTAPHLVVALDNHGVWFGRSIQSGVIKPSKSYLDYKYVCGVLNSSSARFKYNTIVGEAGRVFPQVKWAKIKKLPIPDLPSEKQSAIVDLVSSILRITKNTDYPTNSKKHSEVNVLMKQIDQLVYRLYGLTEEEIKIIEGKASK
ncbi:MAG TPA: N-6 DNA methylase [candidate division Zixibacteria bacterium]|nr:N-6 DNA methylase [candidate division Zixibacteria bacterium]